MIKIGLMIGLGAALTASAKMNILVLTVDDMNCDSVGAFGSAMPDTTPNMDAFAEEAHRFGHAHVHATSCIPSRNVVKTGRYLYNSGVRGFFAVPKDEVTYQTTPEILRDNGYFTMIRGKASHSMPYYPYPAWDIEFDIELKEKKVNIRDVNTFYEYTKKGIEAAQAAGKPFYYAIDIHDPHTALYKFNYKRGEIITQIGADKNNPPSRIFTEDEIVMPGFLPDTPLSRREVTAYYNSVRRADDSFGAVMRALKDTGTWDNTLVVFFSDHGMPFPFAKTAMYYHSSHTPLMVRWPGVTKGGRFDDEHVVGMVDTMPTLLEAVGIPAPEGLDGRSWVPLLKGEKQDGREHTYTMYEMNVGGNCQPMRAVVSKDHTYICNLWSNGERKFATATKGMATTAEMFRLADEGDAFMRERADLFTYGVPEQFFDVNKDPDGLNNLIAHPEYQQLIDKHRKAMVDYMTVSGDPMRGIYDDREDPVAVKAYLEDLDAVSAFNKKHPGIYKRGFAKKAAAEKPAKKVEKKAAKETAGSAATAEGTTLEEHLKRNRERAEKNNKPFDEQRARNWFHAKDANHDGVIDAKERLSKVSADWNQ